MAGGEGSPTLQVSLEAAKKAGFTVLDQCVVSGANFAIGIGLARTLSSADYGGYVVGMSVFYLIFSLSAAILTGPIPVVSAHMSPGNRYAYYAGLLRLLTLAVPSIVLLFVIAHLGSTTVDVLQGRLSSLLPWVGFALSISMAQDFFRKLLLNGLKIKKLLIVDMSSASIQLGLLGLLFYIGGGSVPEGRPGYVSPETTFLSIALGSVCGSLVGFAFERVRRSRESRQAKEAWRLNWDFGKWSLGGVVVGFMGTQSIVFVISAVQGLSGAASYEAARLISGPVQVVIFALAGLIAVRVANISCGYGKRAALAYVDRIMVLGLLGFLSYYAVVYAFFPIFITYTVGSKFLTEVVGVFLFGSYYMLLWVSNLQGALLSGMLRPQKVFNASVVGTTTTLGSAVLLVFLLRTEGGILAMVVGLTGAVITQRLAIVKEIKA
jgi:O-antigen/teichoic acid export membrane protein